MKFLKYATTIRLFIFQTAQSQTFVDDVERVAIVVIDYCVDENTYWYKAIIVSEFTVPC
ncbi:hypothetical protein [Winogradskyella psychrotolerans]|uniref:hypothetical protein n=1 Tax=Winogradskyella psychrotolerans TaxID=1344585 RepID=UPI001C07E8FF|nr:hypothetical protein [Winogradskyella psychrotolerans]MBU2929327.1 hypothetical protein [Winogradskyella psychrotolerans]